MRIGRRLLISTFIVAGLLGHAQAQESYPSQVVRLVVPVAAGSNADILARIVGDKLSQMWPQQVIVENRPGLAGIASVAKSAPDGHTLLLNSNGQTIIGAINSNLPFDPVKDFVGVSQVASTPLILLVTPDLPAKSLKELIDLARAKPGTLNYSSAGVASIGNIASLLFKQVAKIDMVHVPYKGTQEAQNSVMRGDTSMIFGLAVGQDLIHAGKLRALAVSGPTRLSILPDVPTFAEAGLPEFSYDAWFGVLAPAGTPPDVLRKISKDMETVLKMPDVQKGAAALGTTPVSTTPEKFDAMLKADTDRYSGLFPGAKK